MHVRQNAQRRPGRKNVTDLAGWVGAGLGANFGVFEDEAGPLPPC